MESFGGITLSDVIIFQTQIMMGAQFGRIKNPDASQNDILVACLRMGWNDAFRHTSENVKQEQIGKANCIMISLHGNNRNFPLLYAFSGLLNLPSTLPS